MTDGNGELGPASVRDIESWGRRNQRTTTEARQRFAQFAILQAMAAGGLFEHLVLKGGNALRWCYHSPRSTLDLDFTSLTLPDEVSYIRAAIAGALAKSEAAWGVRWKVQSARRNPPGPDKAFPTYTVTVGYQLPRDRHFPDLHDDGVQVAQVIPIEISLNDVVCESQRLSTTHLDIVVCTREDILAEKLRAILQQRVRNRNRYQDVYDIARIVRKERARLDLQKVHRYLLEKCAARSISPAAESFDDALRERAETEYDASLRDDLGADFIPFDLAWGTVVAFARELFAGRS
jgi:predicted nucleotidyltransferase component of viral defense system